MILNSEIEKLIECYCIGEFLDSFRAQTRNYTTFICYTLDGAIMETDNLFIFSKSDIAFKTISTDIDCSLISNARSFWELMAKTAVGKDFHRPIMNRAAFINPTLPLRDFRRNKARKIGALAPKTLVNTAALAVRSRRVPHVLPELSLG